MKKILLLSTRLFLCLILSLTALFTSSLNACECPIFDFNKNLSEGDKVRSNLATGFWVKKSTNKDQKTFIQFHESGRVDWVLSSKKGGTIYKYDTWNLNYFDQTPVLTLKNVIAEVEHAFTLKRTCEGILLTNQSNNATFTLQHQCETQTAVIKSAKIGLAGNWSNATYPYDISKNKSAAGTRKAMKGAYLKICFQHNGTYLKKYGSDKISLIEKGEWEISKDGQFVFLHHNNQTSVAKIQHLDLDEMVIEWELTHPENTDFSTIQKSFAFIR